VELAENLLRWLDAEKCGAGAAHGSSFHSLNVPRDLTVARWSSVLLGATVMVFSLLAYFCSMAVGFVAIMAILIGFGSSQMRTTPLPRYPNPTVSIAETTPSPSRAKLAEREKVAEQNKSEEAQKPAQAREEAKKIARTKVVRERKREMMQARLRQQREERDDSLAWGYANQPFNPFGQRTEY
jgi:hypothetical protein